jgi:hypothetical protein
VDEFDLVFVIGDVVQKVLICSKLFWRGALVFRLLSIALHRRVWVCWLLDHDSPVDPQLSVPPFAVAWLVVLVVVLVGGRVWYGGVDVDMQSRVRFSHGGGWRYDGSEWDGQFYRHSSASIGVVKA